MEVNEFFKWFDKDVRELQTLKAVKVLKKRANKFVREYNESNLVTKAQKLDVARKYKKSLKLLKIKEKKLSSQKISD